MNAPKEQAEMLFNRTGALVNPTLAAELMEGAKDAEPSSDGDSQDFNEIRAAYVDGARIGSKPGAPSKLAGELPAPDPALSVLLDKLSARLVFERTGTRLYEAVISKCELLGQAHDEPALVRLREIYEDELTHFHLVQQAIVDLGGDPTILSPSANVVSVMSAGLVQIVTDPRTTMTQCLQALLNAELADNDGWHMLIDLVTAAGHDDLAESFEEALAAEEQHLDNVREWLKAMVEAEAAGAEEMEKARHATPSEAEVAE